MTTHRLAELPATEGLAEAVGCLHHAAMKMETAATTTAAVGYWTLALINAGLAEQKGRSRLVWFLISLVIGPLATLLIVVLDRPQRLP